MYNVLSFSIQLTIQAIDLGVPPLSSEVNAVVVVTVGRNENDPVFDEEGNYEAAIKRNISRNTVIGRVSAADEDGEVSYLPHSSQSVISATLMSGTYDALTPGARYMYFPSKCNIHFNPYNAKIFLHKLWRPKGFFQFKIIKNLSQLFLIHLNTYVMGPHT